MLVKEKVMNTLNTMPNHFSIDDLMEHLIILEKIETGLAQISEGKVVSHDEVKERVKSWRK